MRLSILFLPGGLFLLVIFFRVALPAIKLPAWKRRLQKAQYERLRKNFDKSDRILAQAVEKFPDRPDVYLEYFLVHSASQDLKHRFEVLLTGYERTKSADLAFFIGSAYLEEGLFEKAEHYLCREGVEAYMINKKVPLLAQLYYEDGRLERAEEEYLRFHRKLDPQAADDKELLSALSAQDLCLYVLISKALGADWRQIMDLVPKSSVHSEMSWKDYLSLLQEQYGKLEPASTGIQGDPGAFNRHRREFFQERIQLIESYL
jgi:tetratricopeptide (TPR) repeat protein